MLNENLNILLIWPRTPKTYTGYEYILPIIGKKSANAPIGILTVAAMLPETWNLKFLDMNVNELDLKYITDWADMVFISAMQIQQEQFKSVVKLCNFSNVPVVAGGPYPTNSFETIDGVSHFVLNEAEITLPEFLKDLKNGTLKHIYKTDKKANLETTPAPRLDLINLNDYAAISVQSSKGCPYDCEFCNVSGTMRNKSVESVIKEFDQIYETGWYGNIFMADDNFIGNKPKVKLLLSAIINWQKEHGYPFNLFTELSINVSEDEQLLKLLREAGLQMMLIGIETPNKDSLKETGKTNNLKYDLLESIHKVQEFGIEVVGGFIVGFDSDDTSIFEQQIEFIEAACIPAAVIGTLTALPNTKLHERLKSSGRLLRESSGGVNTNTKDLDFTPKMGCDNLINGYNDMMKYLYTPKNYFNRCIDLFKRLNSDENYSRNFHLVYIWYLIKSIYVQTFSSYGYHYLSYIIRSLWLKPKLFTEIFRMAIQGHHFFMMVKEVHKK